MTLINMAAMGSSVSEIDDRARRMRIAHATAREIVQPAGSRIGPRHQHEIHLILIHSGSIELTVDAQPPRHVPAGQLCLLLPGHTNEIVVDRAADTRQTLIRGRLENVTEQMRGWLESLRPTRPLSSALTYLAREAVVTEQTRLTADGALLDALATALLWRFVAEFRNLPAALPAPIEAARLYIHTHVADPITLDDIARAASVTPAHLIRLFRTHMNTTPVRYLWDRRISLGVELLTSTGLPVGSVAARCGFKTSFHFARKVRDVTGLPPSALRESHWRA
ncbi:AraC family transcriptional regulator [Jiangella aurantiaca]|uniref:AraC family transcriptional regulator n=2 Tax=Jiangella aurantiaca TaxID=2530373 RepID=A0A4R5ACU3_9ACTN|nr:AraC family transcriptional regulator [Jiangella aurantiaca]